MVWERRTDLTQITQISEKHWGYAFSILKTPVPTCIPFHMCWNIETRTKWVFMEAGHSQDSIRVSCGFVLFYFVGFNP